jgi:hypothetical protein
VLHFAEGGFATPGFLLGFTLSTPGEAQPKLIGWRMATPESRTLLLTITVQAFIPLSRD